MNCYAISQDELKSTGTFSTWIPRSYSNIEAKSVARIASIRASRNMSSESNRKIGFRMPKTWPINKKLNIEAKSVARIASIRASRNMSSESNRKIGFRMPKTWPPKASKSCPLNHLRFMAGPRHYLS